MMTGRVELGEGRIRLKVVGRGGKEHEVEAVVDTGYTASLTLPPALIQALGLRWQTVDRVKLADGSTCIFDVYEAKVMWDGGMRHILVDEADTDPLLGMRLLKGHELRMQVHYRGKVTIQRLPRRSKHGT
jgi:clan AA aspartic protease